MKLILTAALAALIAAPALADGHATTIRMGTEGAYAPYNFLNDAGEIDGFEIELGNEL
ncbi:MAG: transporter substrate-binding domain-containing protein, partial [Pseudomonadota bacterium]